jgi:hypothetical protein
MVSYKEDVHQRHMHSCETQCRCNAQLHDSRAQAIAGCWIMHSVRSRMLFVSRQVHACSDCLLHVLLRDPFGDTEPDLSATVLSSSVTCCSASAGPEQNILSINVYSVCMCQRAEMHTCRVCNASPLSSQEQHPGSCDGELQSYASLVLTLTVDVESS